MIQATQMLLLPVRVEQSSIHGLGAFAIEPIATGSEVWRFTRGFALDLDPGLLDNQPEHFRERLLHYGYLDRRLNRFILCCDDARFINHSGTPNVCPAFTLDRYGVDIAVRDVRPGEEITVNYERFERPSGLGKEQGNASTTHSQSLRSNDHAAVCTGFRTVERRL